MAKEPIPLGCQRRKKRRRSRAQIASATEKYCPRCEQMKPLEAFVISRHSADGRFGFCRLCDAVARKARYNENIEKSREKARVQASRHRKNNPESAYAASRKFRTSDGGERTRQIAKRGYQKDPVAHNLKRREWEKKNPEKHAAEKKAWQKRREQRDPMFRMMRNIGRHIAGVLKGEKRGRQTEALVGYTTDDLRSHIEALFEPGMTWDNYGLWHVDHERPKASFDFVTDVDAVRICWALANLRPMWKKDNHAKGARWNGVNWARVKVKAA